jgi:hypothetical protein
MGISCTGAAKGRAPRPILLKNPDKINRQLRAPPNRAAQAARGVRLTPGGAQKPQSETHHKFAILAERNRHVPGFK